MEKKLIPAVLALQKANSLIIPKLKQQNCQKYHEPSYPLKKGTVDVILRVPELKGYVR